MKAKLLFHEKRYVSDRAGEIAIAEIRVWKIPVSKDYPSGLKFSLFLVKADATVILGIDNHKQKGPHIHFGKREQPYPFVDTSELLADFWDYVRDEGYEP